MKLKTLPEVLRDVQVPLLDNRDRAYVVIDCAKWNAAKALAHEAYLAASRVLDAFDETADPVWTAHAKIACDHAWLLYEALLLETEW